MRFETQQCLSIGQKMGDYSRWQGQYKKKHAGPGISCIWSECESCMNQQMNRETGREYVAEEEQQDMEVQNLRSHCNSSSLVLDSVRHRKSVQLNQQRVRNMFMIGCCANEIELHSSWPFEVCLDASEEHQQAKSCNNLNKRWQERTLGSLWLRW